jgi:hypothetical protein
VFAKPESLLPHRQYDHAITLRTDGRVFLASAAVGDALTRIAHTSPSGCSVSVADVSWSTSPSGRMQVGKCAPGFVSNGFCNEAEIDYLSCTLTKHRKPTCQEKA